MIKTVLALAATTVFASGIAIAKLPPMDDAAKAKAAETAAKAAWQGKVDAYLLCKAQDKVAAKYAKGGAVKPVAAKPAAAPAPAGVASATPAPGVAAAPVIPPCADPGPFAYNPPEQKPLETAGAHSPAGNAASPPNVPQTSAAMRQASAAKKP